MKPQLIYTNDNGDEFAITPLRNNYMLTIVTGKLLLNKKSKGV